MRRRNYFSGWNSESFFGRKDSIDFPITRFNKFGAFTKMYEDKLNKAFQKRLRLESLGNTTYNIKFDHNGFTSFRAVKKR